MKDMNCVVFIKKAVVVGVTAAIIITIHIYKLGQVLIHLQKYGKMKNTRLLAEKLQKKKRDFVVFIKKAIVVK